ncbi:MAG TPA: Na(+)/H(+) antiporter subunit B [Gemmatimonadales bacterium]
MTHLTVLRVVTKLLLPYVLLFAFYVQFHGELSPGGGFQAGVIFAAALVLYSLVFGLRAARRVVPPVVAETFMALGLLLYAGTGLVGLLAGGNYLEYGVLHPANPLTGQFWGIFTIELGVGLGVAATMLTIFFTLAGRRQSE